MPVPQPQATEGAAAQDADVLELLAGVSDADLDDLAAFILDDVGGGLGVWGVGGLGGWGS
jgi:hypothetical protein